MKRALTLLELLIALLVVAGLVLLLIPLARRAREERRQTECRGNLRQIGLALMIYAQDNGGWTPSIEPDARQIANAAGLPAGCVLTFKDTDGTYRASGLGRLQEGGYLAHRGLDVLYCPSTHGDDARWVKAVSPDEDEAFWRIGKPGPTDGDGVGELPGNADVMLSGYLLRFHTNDQWGSINFKPDPNKVLACDLFSALTEGTVANHGNLYHYLWHDGTSRSDEDKDGALRELLANAPVDDIEATLDKKVFIHWGNWWGEGPYHGE